MSERDLSDAEIEANISECAAHGYAVWDNAGPAHITLHGADIFWALATLMTDEHALSSIAQWMRFLVEERDA